MAYVAVRSSCLCWTAQSPQILFADAFPIISPGLASLAKPSGSQWIHQMTQQFLVFLQLKIEEATTPVPKSIHKGPFHGTSIFFLQYTAGCLIRGAGCSRNHHRRCTCSWYCGCHRSRCGAAGGCRHSRQSLRRRSPWHTSRLKHLQMLWHPYIIWQKRPNNSKKWLSCGRHGLSPEMAIVRSTGFELKAMEIQYGYILQSNKTKRKWLPNKFFCWKTPKIFWGFSTWPSAARNL